MLILSSKLDQSVYLDFASMTDAELLALRRERVVVTVCEIRKGRDGSSVRIGYRAPNGIEIHRAKVWEARRRESAAAETKGKL